MKTSVPSRDRELFFLSCVTTDKEIEKLKDDKRIISIYHVSGVEPWLIVCQFDSFNDVISLNYKHQLNIEDMSIARSIALVNRKKEVAHTTDKITFWVFIKGIRKKEEFESFINEIVDIYEAYEIFGEYNFIVKLYTQNINGIDDFLSRCQKEGLSTFTKCVLSTKKENGRKIDDDINTKNDEVLRIKKDINYAMARIMTNTKGFIQQSKDEQIKLLESRLVKLGIALSSDLNDFILDPDATKLEYSQDDLVHPNNLIDKYSVKLNRSNWPKVLLFFKAAHGKRGELEEALQELFLGVTSYRFARKLYHITGDYDFFIPFDCNDLNELNRSIEDFWKWQAEKEKELITSFTSIICRPSEDGRGEGPLGVFDIPFIEALLINATQMSKFEERIRSEVANPKIFLPVLEGRQLIPSEEGISPREDYVRTKLKDENKDAIKNYLNRFTSFEDIGLESTIEFKDGALIHVLANFYFRTPAFKREFLEELKDKIANYEIIATCYEPIMSPQTVTCILMVKDLVELEILFNEFIRFCNKIEFHIIFHQTCYSKAIEKNIRCKPGFYPFKPPKDCGKECDVVKWTCENSKKCVIQKCGNCVKYIHPRKRNQILNIDFRERIQRKIEIVVVGVDLSLSQYFVLEKLLDQEECRDKIFKNYRKFERKFKKNMSPYGNSNDIFRDYKNMSVNKEAYREKYKCAINNLLDHILKSEYPQIIVFPEYTIPSYVYSEIRKKNIKTNCIILAGSHINNGFNICPIIFNQNGEKNIYHYCKNNFSEFEEELGLVTNIGTGYLKFLNTIMGNLYIQVCFDGFAVGEHEIFKNVDILLIPSFNPSTKFIEIIKNKACIYKSIVAYANTINKKTIKSNFFVPPNNGLNKNPRNISPFHKDQWPKGEQITGENIFNVIEDKQYNIGGFNFTVKRLVTDIIQLDMRRDNDQLKMKR